MKLMYGIVKMGGKHIGLNKDGRIKKNILYNEDGSYEIEEREFFPKLSSNRTTLEISYDKNGNIIEKIEYKYEITRNMRGNGFDYRKLVYKNEVLKKIGTYVDSLGHEVFEYY